MNSRPDFSDDDSSFFLRLEKKEKKQKKTYQLTQHLRVRALILVTTTTPVHLSPERKNIKEQEKEKENI